nr:prolyl oligopeptidase family serine peptidase [Sphingomonas sp. Y57]
MADEDSAIRVSRALPEIATERDIRSTTLYREAEQLAHRLRQPGHGALSDAFDLHASPCGRHASFTGVIVDTLEGTPPTGIFRIALESGEVTPIGANTGKARHARHSPNGRWLAFIADARGIGDDQLHLADLTNGSVRTAARVTGWVETLRWSRDGTQILLGVAGTSADVSSGQGATTHGGEMNAHAAWMPRLDGTAGTDRRSAWVYTMASDTARPLSPPNCNIWEADWAGGARLVAIASAGAHEGAWYDAHLTLIEARTGVTQLAYQPNAQLGCLATSPDGRWAAFVEALCSDRLIVAGDLMLADLDSGDTRRLDTGGVDITSLEWRSADQLLLAGHQGLATVIGCWSFEHGWRETWRSIERTTAGRYATIAGIGDDGDCLMIGESFFVGPEIARVAAGAYQTIRPLHDEAKSDLTDFSSVAPFRWQAADGLELEGWLLGSSGDGPAPLLVDLHGGPILHWRASWLGRSNLVSLMLLARGYAIFLPNPRGSSGHGQAFARRVLGDMGGADSADCLAGIDALIAAGIADPAQVSLTGLSYGGYLAAWLATQEDRFAAAVPVAPITSFVTHHLQSNIPEFAPLFLADAPTRAGSRFWSRSPLGFAENVRTPVLGICGALDRCTPPEEARQFHDALRARGATSALLTYQEGHGVRSWPAALDAAARTVGWIEHFSAARRHASEMDI